MSLYTAHVNISQKKNNYTGCALVKRNDAKNKEHFSSCNANECTLKTF